MKYIILILSIIFLASCNPNYEDKAKSKIKEYYKEKGGVSESDIVEYSQLFPEKYDCKGNTEATRLSLQIATFDYAVSINPNVSEESITEYKENKKELDEIALKYSLPITKYSMFCIYSLDGINRKENRFIFNKDITKIEVVF